jgi:hypothetical protein
MLLIVRAAGARTLQGDAGLPWKPFAGDPRLPVEPGP